MSLLGGWGRYPLGESALLRPRSLAAARAATSDTEAVVARGAGRAYGDAAIGARATLETSQLDRMRAFDDETGILSVEGGVRLADVIDTFLPRGFFPKVVPGTRFVSVGGAVAADIHGKNHHVDGGFGDTLESLTLATPDGAQLRLSRTENAELFFATVGGMGLTGTVLEATWRLSKVETGWIRQRTIEAANLSQALAALSAGHSSTYSVAWIDGLATGARLGRSLIFLGEPARRDELDARARRLPFGAVPPPRYRIPFDFPGFALNRLSVGAFNELYYRLGARRTGAPFLVPAGPYFFPLDGIAEWNRIYGRAGFIQHQCVVPEAAAEATLGEILSRVAARGDASFLAVLKKLGPGTGLLSFPMPGYTLALDFPLRPGLLEFLDDLDRLVVAAGGRLYLAKDSRQSRATFEAGYPDLPKFREIRRAVDPRGRLRSRLSDRLGLS